MYKIFNYNKASNKKINYKLYRFLLIMLWFIAVFFLIVFVIVFFLNAKVGTVLLNIYILLFIIIYILFGAKLLILFRKYFNCAVYVLNENSKEFYKIGIFPNIIDFEPNHEEFITDNYFANYIYSNWKKYFKLSLIKDLSYSLKDSLKKVAKDFVSLKSSEGWTILYLNPLIKLNDLDYILKQLNNKKFKGMVFKITKIYSYEFNENENYYIICDVIENNKQTEYKKVKLAINKLFEENDTIKNYIINNCENNINVINEEVQYESRTI